LSTESAQVDAAYAELEQGAEALSKIGAREAAAIAREVLAGLEETAAETVLLGCRAKGVDPDSRFAGEEWLAGPCVILAYARELAEKLDGIAEGRTAFPGGAPKARERDGRLTAACGPGNALIRTALGTELTAIFEEGSEAHALVANQAKRWKSRAEPPRISLVLGAGNVASIAPVDVLQKVFVDREAVLLKPSPVNDYLAPLLERAFAPLVSRGMLRMVKGGPEIGAALVAHAKVSDIHVTGSVETHDRIVWGPPGDERARRKAANEPIFPRPITSELGNVSPVIVVPALYAADELAFQAKSVAAQVTNNASFNCNAAKMIVLPKGWKQRDQFLDLVMGAMAAAPTRKAYYPGATDRYQKLTEGRAPRKAGSPKEGELAWTLIDGLDPKSDDTLFSTEPFCCIVSEVSIGSDDPIEFLAEATRFCNDKLFGTLCAEIIVHPMRQSDPATARALDDATLGLLYGSVAINTWPALVYASATPPWGGHPSDTIADVQSGVGWSHNAWMLEGVEKVIAKAPLKAMPKPAFFADNAKMRTIGERLAPLLAHPGPVNLARLIWEAVRG
jgi:acyl-CoA reductase-like NAD-dependent aldehyde dehydrogenase